MTYPQSNMLTADYPSGVQSFSPQTPPLGTFQYGAANSQSVKPSSNYLLCVMGRQFVGSGNGRDASGNDADLVINSAYTDAATWAAPGYITTAAGTNLKLQADKTRVNFSLGTQSIICSFRMNKATPVGTEYICGNGGGTNPGFYISVNSAGKVQVLITNAAGNTTGMGSVSTPVFADGTDHVLSLALDGFSKKLFLWIDGTICDMVQTAFTTTTAPTQDFSFGAFNGSQSTTYVGKYSDIHLLAFTGGLPATTNAIVAKLSRLPGAPLTDFDTYAPTVKRVLGTIIGQSNELGTGVTRDTNNSFGPPLRDVATTRSCWPRLATQAGLRNVWMEMYNQAKGGTSIVDSWTGNIRNWVTSMNVVRGTWLLSSGGIWKCNGTAGATLTSTTQPTGTADTTGADAIPWLYLGVPTNLDVVGVLTEGHSRFDPNGYIASALSGLTQSTGYDTLIAMISFGQTDVALVTSRTNFALGIRSITNYFVARGYKVAIGFTCYFPSGEAYYQSTLLPGLADALAFYAGNSNVITGANWRTALGVLATNPASGPGLQADATHMNDLALNLAAAAWRDALANGNII